jgi:hypothetical protein
MTAMIAALCAPLFTGCFSTVLEPDADPAQVVIATRLPGSPAAPARLVVTLASSRGDTLRDTVTEDGSRLSRRPAFLDARPGRGQSVTTEYELAPNRHWKVQVRLLDKNDSLQMTDSTLLESLKAFERRDAELAPSERFASFPARFVLPASQGGRRIEFTRLQLIIDGKVIHDSVAPLRKSFAPGEANAVVLAHDYLPRGNYQVTLGAWGRVEGEDASTDRLLAKGESDFEAVPGQGVAAAQPISLAWTDSTLAPSPESDAVAFHVSIGKVGKVNLVAEMSGSIDF